MDRVRSLIVLALAIIAIQMIVVASAYAAKIPVSWSAPILNTDGSPLTDLKSYRVEWGVCNGQSFGAVQGSLVVPASVTSTSITPTGINPVCIRVYAINAAGVSSDPSNSVQKILPGPLSKPVTLGQPITLPPKP